MPKDPPVRQRSHNAYQCTSTCSKLSSLVKSDFRSVQRQLRLNLKSLEFCSSIYNLPITASHCAESPRILPIPQILPSTILLLNPLLRASPTKAQSSISSTSPQFLILALTSSLSHAYQAKTSGSRSATFHRVSVISPYFLSPTTHTSQFVFSPDRPAGTRGLPNHPFAIGLGFLPSETPDDR